MIFMNVGVLATIEDLRADIAKLEQQFSAVEQERDALREALKQIASGYSDPMLIARAALEAEP